MFVKQKGFIVYTWKDVWQVKLCVLRKYKNLLAVFFLQTFSIDWIASDEQAWEKSQRNLLKNDIYYCQ